MGAVAVRKHYTVTKVTTPDDDNLEGRFTALVSVFNNVDYQGDVIEPGAFDDTIAAFAAGLVIPVIWSHDYWQPESIIGEVTAMRATEKGLEVDCILDIAESSKAAHIFRQLVKGRLREFSIGGEIPEDGWKLVKHPDDGETYVHIIKLDLWEIGPCFKGANPETELLSTKARLTKSAAPAILEPEAVEPLEPEADPNPDQHDANDVDEDQDPTPEPDQLVRLSRSTQALLGLMQVTVYERTPAS